jgi:hypothetical protein
MMLTFQNNFNFRTRDYSVVRALHSACTLHASESPDRRFDGLSDGYRPTPEEKWKISRFLVQIIVLRSYTIQYNTIQYNTIQYNTIQYNII